MAIDCCTAECRYAHQAQCTARGPCVCGGCSAAVSAHCKSSSAVNGGVSADRAVSRVGMLHQGRARRAGACAQPRWDVQGAWATTKPPPIGAEACGTLLDNGRKVPTQTLPVGPTIPRVLLGPLAGSPAVSHGGDGGQGRARHQPCLATGLSRDKEQSGDDLRHWVLGGR